MGMGTCGEFLAGGFLGVANSFFGQSKPALPRSLSGMPKPQHT